MKGRARLAGEGLEVLRRGATVGADLDAAIGAGREDGLFADEAEGRDFVDQGRVEGDVAEVGSVVEAVGRGGGGHVWPLPAGMTHHRVDRGGSQVFSLGGPR